MSTTKTHDDQKYIDGLAQNNAFIIQSIYDNFAPKIINYIKQNSGDAYDAQDVIQETIITIYHQAKLKNLQLTCPFEAYFFLLCKRKWLNQLKKNTITQVTINNDLLSKDADTQVLALDTERFEAKDQLFSEMFQKLGDACKNVLNTSFILNNMEQVAKQLNISYAYARKKKSLCIKKLTEMVKASPKFKALNP